MRVLEVCTRSWFWLGTFTAWAVLLWILSGTQVPANRLPPVPGADKLAHFSYFLLGALLLAAFLVRRWPPLLGRPTLVVLVVAFLAMMGWIDEWHQSWVPGRSGNDLGDWIADTLGALAGALMFPRLLRRLAATSAGA